MAAHVLVSDDIRSGLDLTNALIDHRVPVTATFWVLDTQEDWRFVVVSPLVDDHGLREAYHQVVPVLNEVQDQQPPDRIFTIDHINVIGVPARDKDPRTWGWISQARHESRSRQSFWTIMAPAQSDQSTELQDA